MHSKGVLIWINPLSHDINEWSLIVAPHGQRHYIFIRSLKVPTEAAILGSGLVRPKSFHP